MKFPAVNIPTTMPGLDLLCWAIWVPVESMSLLEMYRRPNTSQLALNPIAQSKAKDGYTYFWDVIVVGSRNPDAVDMKLPAPMMREDFYKNAAGDKYPLLDHNLQIITIPTAGYSEQLLLDWLYSIKLDLNLARMAFYNSGSYEMVPYNTDPKKLVDFDEFQDDLNGVYKKIRSTQSKNKGASKGSSSTGGSAVTPSSSSA